MWGRVGYGLQGDPSRSLDLLLEAAGICTITRFAFYKDHSIEVRKWIIRAEGS